MEYIPQEVRFVKGMDSGFIPEITTNRFNSASTIDLQESRYNAPTRMRFTRISEDNL